MLTVTKETELDSFYFRFSRRDMAQGSSKSGAKNRPMSVHFNNPQQMAIANGGPSGDEKENSLPRVIVTIEILFLSFNILKTFISFNFLYCN